MQPEPDQIEKLVRIIVDAVHPLQIVLFGSAARGEARATSDIDIMVLMPEGTHRRRTAQYLYRIASGITVPFDLIVATPGDIEKHRDNVGLIYRAILEEGKTLYAA